MPSSFLPFIWYGVWVQPYWFALYERGFVDNTRLGQSSASWTDVKRIKSSAIRETAQVFVFFHIATKSVQHRTIFVKSDGQKVLVYEGCEGADRFTEDLKELAKSNQQLGALLEG